MKYGKFYAEVLMTFLFTGAVSVASFAGATLKGVDYINNPAEASLTVGEPSVQNEQSSVAETEESESSTEEPEAVKLIDGIRVPTVIKSDEAIQADLSVLPGGGANMDWGNYYPAPNSVPVGNADESWLRSLKTYSRENTQEKACYLTFDLGYENGHTLSIMETLKKHNAPATIFVTGACIKSNPEIVLAIAKNGFTVGNHTLNHKNMSGVTTKEMFFTEVNTVEEQYEALTGHPMNRYYRPPEGKSSQAQLMLAEAMGYKTMLWSVAYKDYDEKAQPSRESALATLNKRIHPGAIVLLHATSRTNAAILDELLTGWESAGYTFKSLDELPENEFVIQ